MVQREEVAQKYVTTQRYEIIQRDAIGSEIFGGSEIRC